MRWGTNESGGPMRWGTNEMSGAWVLIGGSMRWGTNEMGDQWDGEPMRWGTNEMGDQWCAPLQCTCTRAGLVSTTHRADTSPILAHGIFTGMLHATHAMTSFIVSCSCCFKFECGCFKFDKNIISSQLLQKLLRPQTQHYARLPRASAMRDRQMTPQKQ